MKTHRNLMAIILLSLVMQALAQPKQGESLVPNTPSQAPDYFCTWNVQGYVDSYKTERANMNEKYMFGTGKWQNWVSFYPKIRQDLYFVMDDSWDIPQKENINKNTDGDLGMVQVNKERFPSFTGNATERMRKLVEKVKSYGWKGLGGWVCAQKAGNDKDFPNEDDYWKDRLQVCEKTGFDYWKVDWGKNMTNTNWRQKLSDLARQYAPHVWVEAASGSSNPRRNFVQFADVYRTYDVENIIAQTQTIQRVANLLSYKKTTGKGIINCEDEPQIAVGLGCAIGVMRHPFTGNLPNGNSDFAFPAVGRNYKMRVDEVIRGVRWHRIAEPFGVNNDGNVDGTKLNDYWTYHSGESWRSHKNNEKIEASAPARISRNMPLPTTDSKDSQRPYILASKYPNGAVAVVTIGRTIDRKYISNKINVNIQADSWTKPFGIFGYFKNLTIDIKNKLQSTSKAKVWAQDLAGDTPVDITNDVTIKSNQLVIPGSVIERVGLMAKSKNDQSDPGLVLQVYADEDESQGDDNKYYLYNVGQGKFVKTGGSSKNPDTPELADWSEATAQVATKNDDGTYTIADEDWPKGWGFQGRNTVYISMDGGDKTNSWGTNYTPGFNFVNNSDGSIYIEYQWPSWTSGSVSIEDPSYNTYMLTYGNYDHSTNGWSNGQKNDVSKPLIFGGSVSNASSYGSNAKWILMTRNQYTGIDGIKINKNISETSIYNINGQKVAANDKNLNALPKGVYIRNGKKIVVR